MRVPCLPWFGAEVLMCWGPAGAETLSQADDVGYKLALHAWTDYTVLHHLNYLLNLLYYFHSSNSDINMAI